MRYGFTTGSCAAAAAKAATYMLLTGKEKHNISIETPKGIPYHARIVDVQREPGSVSCAVEKDGGDDPDVTTGMWVYAMVRIVSDEAYWEKEQSDVCNAVKVQIDGGKGVGRVTKPGLDQPIGNAAINTVPREMIEKEIKEVCFLCDFYGTLSVIISVPNGETIAKKTFNERLGIEGGISILGTRGIVEPMSKQALVDTIAVELRQHYESGEQSIVISPGNYGQAFMQEKYQYDLTKSVKCSNFIGETIDHVVELGFSKMLFVGHIGKLIKVSGGIMNTHSGESDCRLELLAAAMMKAYRKKHQKDMSEGNLVELTSQLLECVTTEAGLAILKNEHLLSETMEEVFKQIMFYLNKRAQGRVQMECILFSNEFGELAKSKGAVALLRS